MGLEPAEYNIFTHGQGKYIKTVWYAEANGLRVEYVTTDPDLKLWIDHILTMREVGIALVDETRTMRANSRRDRRGNE